MKSTLIAIVILLIVGVAAVFFFRMLRQSGQGVALPQYGTGTSGTSGGTSGGGASSSQPATGQGMTLTITSPQDGATVTSATVLVKGKTAGGAEVFVNDKETKADTNGNFSVSLTLDEGENIINVAVNDANGNYAEKEITVTYQAS